jgi:hypothetical protein
MIIVGAGQVGGRAALTLRETGHSGRIALWATPLLNARQLRATSRSPA